MRLPKTLLGLVCLSALSAVGQGTGNARLRAIGSVPLAGSPVFDQSLFAAGNILISHAGAQSVDVFEPKKRRIIGHIANLKDPRGIAFDEASNTIYVACAGSNSIAVVDAKELKVTKSMPLPARPQDLAFSAQEKLLYASGAATPQLIIVPTDGSAASTLDVGGRIGGLALDPAAKRLYLSINNQNEVVAVTTGAKPEIAQHWKLNASQPTGLTLDAETGRLFVAVRYAVLSLNTNTGQEISRVPTAAGTDTLRYLPTDKLLYAGSTDGTVTVIDASKGNLVASDEIKAGVKGHSIAVDATTHMLYVPGGFEGHAKLAILKPFVMKYHDTDEDEDDTKAPAQSSSPKPSPNSTATKTPPR